METLKRKIDKLKLEYFENEAFNNKIVFLKKSPNISNNLVQIPLITRFSHFSLLSTTGHYLMQQQRLTRHVFQRIVVSVYRVMQVNTGSCLV